MDYENPHLTNVRYNYFDAIRGFAMILVVFWHVMYFSLDSIGGVNLIFYSFREALFFFISGFFAYKPFGSWDKFRIKYSLSGKFKVQIVGTFVFIALSSIFDYNRLPDRIDFNGYAQGYWFTLVLFRYFLVYIAVMLICRKVSGSEKPFWVIILSLAVLCACIYCNFLDSKEIISTKFPFTTTIFISHLAIQYFPYFVIGLLARAFLPVFEKILSDDKARLAAICLAAAIWAMHFLSDTLGIAPHLGGHVLISYPPVSYPLAIVMIALVIQFFYSVRHVFDGGSRFAKAMRLIGRRTLDIYFLHYFFLPEMPFLQPYFQFGNPALLQLAIGAPLAMIIVGLTLLVGRIIRMSPVLGEWLLGAGKKRMAAASQAR